jgi:hypothetical protein
MANLQDLFNDLQADPRVKAPQTFEEFASKMETPEYADRIDGILNRLGYDSNQYEGLKKKEESMVESAPLSQSESEQPSATTETTQEVGTESVAPSLLDANFLNQEMPTVSTVAPKMFSPLVKPKTQEEQVQEAEVSTINPSEQPESAGSKILALKDKASSHFSNLMGSLLPQEAATAEEDFEQEEDDIISSTDEVDKDVPKERKPKRREVKTMAEQLYSDQFAADYETKKNLVGNTQVLGYYEPGDGTYEMIFTNQLPGYSKDRANITAGVIGDETYKGFIEKEFTPIVSQPTIMKYNSKEKWDDLQKAVITKENYGDTTGTTWQENQATHLGNLKAEDVANVIPAAEIVPLDQKGNIEKQRWQNFQNKAKAWKEKTTAAMEASRKDKEEYQIAKQTIEGTNYIENLDDEFRNSGLESNTILMTLNQNSSDREKINFSNLAMGHGLNEDIVIQLIKDKYLGDYNPEIAVEGSPRFLNIQADPNDPEYANKIEAAKTEKAKNLYYDMKRDAKYFLAEQYIKNQIALGNKAYRYEFLDRLKQAKEQRLDEFTPYNFDGENYIYATNNLAIDKANATWASTIFKMAEQDYTSRPLSQAKIASDNLRDKGITQTSRVLNFRMGKLQKDIEGVKQEVGIKDEKFYADLSKQIVTAKKSVDAIDAEIKSKNAVTQTQIDQLSTASTQLESSLGQYFEKKEGDEGSLYYREGVNQQEANSVLDQYNSVQKKIKAVVNKLNNTPQEDDVELDMSDPQIQAILQADEETKKVIGKRGELTKQFEPLNAEVAKLNQFQQKAAPYLKEAANINSQFQEMSYDPDVVALQKLTPILNDIEISNAENQSKIDPETGMYKLDYGVNQATREYRIGKDGQLTSGNTDFSGIDAYNAANEKKLRYDAENMSSLENAAKATGYGLTGAGMSLIRSVLSVAMTPFRMAENPYNFIIGSEEETKKGDENWSDLDNAMEWFDQRAKDNAVVQNNPYDEDYSANDWTSNIMGVVPDLLAVYFTGGLNTSLVSGVMKGKGLQTLKAIATAPSTLYFTARSQGQLQKELEDAGYNPLEATMGSAVISHVVAMSEFLFAQSPNITRLTLSKNLNNIVKRGIANKLTTAEIARQVTSNLFTKVGRGALIVTSQAFKEGVPEEGLQTAEEQLGMTILGTREGMSLVNAKTGQYTPYSKELFKAMATGAVVGSGMATLSTTQNAYTEIKNKEALKAVQLSIGENFTEIVKAGQEADENFKETTNYKFIENVKKKFDELSLDPNFGKFNDAGRGALLDLTLKQEELVKADKAFQGIGVNNIKLQNQIKNITAALNKTLEKAQQEATEREKLNAELEELGVTDYQVTPAGDMIAVNWDERTTDDEMQPNFEKAKSLVKTFYTNLSKTETNAVQEQTTSEVPVQSETTDGQQVAKGEPKTELQATPQEGREKGQIDLDIEEVQKATGAVIKLNEDGTLTITTPEKGGQSKKDAAIENATQKLANLGYNVESRVIESTQQETAAEEETQQGPTDEEFGTAIQESEDLGIVAGTEAMSALAKEHKKDANKSKILTQATRAVKTLNSLFPNMKIVLHNDDESYNSAMEKLGGKQNTRGQFVYKPSADGSMQGAIHINLNRANARTIAHEISHAALLKMFKGDGKLFNKFKESISQLAKDKQITLYENGQEEKTTWGAVAERLSRKYTTDKGFTEEDRSEEYLSELAGLVASLDLNKDENKTLLKMIADFINEFLFGNTEFEKLGLKPISDTSSAEEVLEFFETLGKKISRGEEITSLEEIEEIVTPGTQVDGTVITSKSAIDDSVIENFDTTPIQDPNNPVSLIYPEKSSIEEVLKKSGGAAIFINSDGTKVGSALVNGKTLITHGGPDYTYIEQNVDEEIGFAASEDEKIKTLQAMALEVQNMRDEQYPEHKGKPVAVFVTIQNGDTMLGEWYAAEYIMEGLDKAIESKKYPGGIRKAKGDFIKAIEAVNTNTKTVSGKQDAKSKKKLIDYIKSNKFNTREGRLDIAKFLSSKEFSFGFRVNLNGELIPSNEKSWNSGKNRDFKKAMSLSNHTMDDFYDNFLDPRLLNIVKNTKLASDKGRSIANRTFSGFYYNPNVPIEQQVEHAKLGIEHNQFNSSFKSEGNFLLKNAHNVNKLNPNMGYPTLEGYYIYNENNNTEYTKANSGLKEKNIISTWLNENNYSKLVVNPYSSIALSIYTGYVEDISKADKSKESKKETPKTKPGVKAKSQIDIDAENSPLYKNRTQADVMFVSNERVRGDVPNMDKATQGTEAKGIKIKPGMLVGSRLNINASNKLKYPVMTIHDTKSAKSTSGEAISTMGNITLNNVSFNVDPLQRDKIASGGQKGVMAMAVGTVSDSAPNFNGLELSFNPKRENMFVDEDGRAVLAAEEVTLTGNKAYARGMISYAEPSENISKIYEEKKGKALTAPSRAFFSESKEEILKRIPPKGVVAKSQLSDEESTIARNIAGDAVSIAEVTGVKKADAIKQAVLDLMEGNQTDADKFLNEYPEMMKGINNAFNNINRKKELQRQEDAGDITVNERQALLDQVKIGIKNALEGKAQGEKEGREKGVKEGQKEGSKFGSFVGFFKGLAAGRAEQRGLGRLVSDYIKDAVESGLGKKGYFSVNMLKSISRRAANISNQKQLDAFVNYLDTILSNKLVADITESIENAKKKARGKNGYQYSAIIKQFASFDLFNSDGDLVYDYQTLEQYKKALDMINQQTPNIGGLTDLSPDGVSSLFDFMAEINQQNQPAPKSLATSLNDWQLAVNKIFNNAKNIIVQNNGVVDVAESVKNYRTFKSNVNKYLKALDDLLAAGMISEVDYERLFNDVKDKEAQYNTYADQFQDEIDEIKKTIINDLLDSDTKDLIDLWLNQTSAFTPTQKKLAQQILRASRENLMSLSLDDLDVLNNAVTQLVENGFVDEKNIRTILDRAEIRGQNIGGELNKQLEKVKQKFRGPDAKENLENLLLRKATVFWESLLGVKENKIYRKYVADPIIQAFSGWSSGVNDILGKYVDVVNSLKVKGSRKVWDRANGKDKKVSNASYMRIKVGVIGHILDNAWTAKMDKKPAKDWLQKILEDYNSQNDMAMRSIDELYIVQDVYNRLLENFSDSEGNLDHAAVLTAFEKGDTNVMDSTERTYYSAAQNALQEAGEYINSANSMRDKGGEINPYYMPRQYIGATDQSNSTDVNHNSQLGQAVRSSASYQRVLPTPDKALNFNVDSLVFSNVNEGVRDFYLTDAKRYVNEVFRNARENMTDEAFERNLLRSLQELSKGTIEFGISQQDGKPNGLMTKINTLFFTTALIGSVRTPVEFFNNIIGYSLGNRSFKSLSLPFKGKEKQETENLLKEFNSSIRFDVPTRNISLKKERVLSGDTLVDIKAKKDSQISMIVPWLNNLSAFMRKGEWKSQFDRAFERATGEKFDYNKHYVNGTSEDYFAMKQAASDADFMARRIMRGGSKAERRQFIQVLPGRRNVISVNSITAPYLSLLTDFISHDVTNMGRGLTKTLAGEIKEGMTQTLGGLFRLSLYPFLMGVTKSMMKMYTGDDEEKEEGKEDLQALTTKDGWIDMGLYVAEQLASTTLSGKFGTFGKIGGIAFLDVMYNLTDDPKHKTFIKDMLKEIYFVQPYDIKKRDEKAIAMQLNNAFLPMIGTLVRNGLDLIDDALDRGKEQATMYDLVEVFTKTPEGKEWLMAANLVAQAAQITTLLLTKQALPLIDDFASYVEDNISNSRVKEINPETKYTAPNGQVIDLTDMILDDKGMLVTTIEGSSPESNQALTQRATEIFNEKLKSFKRYGSENTPADQMVNYKLLKEIASLSKNQAKVEMGGNETPVKLIDTGINRVVNEIVDKNELIKDLISGKHYTRRQSSRFKENELRFVNKETSGPMKQLYDNATELGKTGISEYLKAVYRATYYNTQEVPVKEDYFIIRDGKAVQTPKIMD